MVRYYIFISVLMFYFQRNRRMFGSILGTLQKFRADETKVKDRELKKRQIEAKIDKKTEKEREEAIRQKKELFEDKRRKEREIKVLQVKFEVPSVLHL